MWMILFCWAPSIPIPHYGTQLHMHMYFQSFHDFYMYLLALSPHRLHPTTELEIIKMIMYTGIAGSYLVTKLTPIFSRELLMLCRYMYTSVAWSPFAMYFWIFRLPTLNQTDNEPPFCMVLEILLEAFCIMHQQAMTYMCHTHSCT